METEPTVEAELTTQTGSTESDSSPLLEDELLVEEISIDGMCGVY